MTIQPFPFWLPLPPPPHFLFAHITGGVFCDNEKHQKSFCTLWFSLFWNFWSKNWLAEYSLEFGFIFLEFFPTLFSVIPIPSFFPCLGSQSTVVRSGTRRGRQLQGPLSGWAVPSGCELFGRATSALPSSALCVASARFLWDWAACFPLEGSLLVLLSLWLITAELPSAPAKNRRSLWWMLCLFWAVQGTAGLAAHTSPPCYHHKRNADLCVLFPALVWPSGNLPAFHPRWADFSPKEDCSCQALRKGWLAR